MVYVMMYDLLAKNLDIRAKFFAFSEVLQVVSLFNAFK